MWGDFFAPSIIFWSAAGGISGNFLNKPVATAASMAVAAPTRLLEYAAVLG